MLAEASTFPVVAVATESWPPNVRKATRLLHPRGAAAVVYLLRKVIWWVPDFTVDRYLDRLRDLHDRMRLEGPGVAHSTRHLVEARRPEE